MIVNTRLEYLLIGCAIGFIVGWFTRSLKEATTVLEEVEKPMILSLKGTEPGGLIKSRLGTNIALFLVVALTAWAAFASQNASNRVTNSQKEQDKSVLCTQTFLASTISALNARTQNSQEQNEANSDLQKAQATFLGVFFITPPASTAQRSEALKTYFDALTRFTTSSATTGDNVAKNPYPTPTDFLNCIHGK